MKRNKSINLKPVGGRSIQTTQKTSKQFISKKPSHKDIESVWTAIQKKEKELINKNSPQAKKQRQIITGFLRNHQLNFQTGYIESKWKEKTHYVSCGPEVIK